MSRWFRYAPLPVPWPGGKLTTERKRSPFRATWEQSTKLLEHEIGQLAGSDVSIALNLPANIIRKDGGLYDRARVSGPEVVVSFTTEGQGRLVLPSDTYLAYADNARAIALTLKQLRAIDRYGVVHGRQYTGLKQLPAFTTPTMNTAQAADAVARRAGEWSLAEDIVSDHGYAKDAIRAALAATHPDKHNGRSTDFLIVGEAKRILSAHHGVAL